jgi:hypothetical protein
MLRKFLLLTLSVFITNCVVNKNEGQKSIKLSSGKTVEVLYKKHASPETGTVFSLECSTGEKIVKEETVETDVLEIWAEIEKEADETGLREAVISYKYLVENVNEKGDAEKVVTVSFFTAEKMENGKWKIDKIG